jgi:hypothetical protein
VFVREEYTELPPESSTKLLPFPVSEVYFLSMDRWTVDFHRGIRYLSEHDPNSAILYLSRAVQGCPVNRSEQLTKALYYLGVALKRIGYSNSAIRSWVTSHKMKKSRHTRELLDRFCNEYGMAKQDSEAQDDWQAFYSVQLMRYLRGFRKRTLSDRVERSMIADIVREAWKRLRDSGVLQGCTPEEKYEIFQKTKIDFPLFYYGRLRDPVVRINFSEGRRYKAQDPCACGSGLPYCCCCGRNPGEEELSAGLF